MIEILIALLLMGAPAPAPESPFGKWKTIDAKTGKARSEVEVYEQGGKLFGKITSIPELTGRSGTPKVCTTCTDADKDKPIVGLVILKDLVLSGDRYQGGTITDPEDGTMYKAEVWTEEGTLKVRRSFGKFSRTQTWRK